MADALAELYEAIEKAGFGRRICKSWTKRARATVRLEHNRQARGLRPRRAPVTMERLSYRLSTRALSGNIPRDRGKRKLRGQAPNTVLGGRKRDGTGQTTYRSNLFAPAHIKALRSRLASFKQRRGR